MPNQAIDPAKLLAGLKKAIPEPLEKLQGPKGLFPGGAKSKPLADHVAKEGYVAEHTETRPPTGRSKTPKEVTVYVLTEKGRQYIADAESPRPLLETIVPLLEKIANRKQESAKHDVATLVADATKQCTQTIQSAFESLQQSISTALQTFEQRISDVQSHSSAKGDELANVLPLIRMALKQPSQPSSVSDDRPHTPEPPPPKSESASPNVEEPTDIRKTLKEKYDYLCLYKEFQGHHLVEIPRLYIEAKRKLPSLTVERFHEELQSLERDRKAELHEINEVHDAKHPEYALRRNDRLYYFILWK